MKLNKIAETAKSVVKGGMAEAAPSLFGMAVVYSVPKLVKYVHDRVEIVIVDPKKKDEES